MARLCRWITQRLHVGRQIEGHNRSCCVGWTVLPRTRMYTVFAGRTRSFVGRTCLLSVAILWLWPGCGRDDRRGMRSDARRERSDDMRCPNCGCEVAGDRLYCPFCGVSMGGAVDLGQGETTSWDGVAATAGSGDAVTARGLWDPLRRWIERARPKRTARPNRMSRRSRTRSRLRFSGARRHPKA